MDFKIAFKEYGLFFLKNPKICFHYLSRPLFTLNRLFYLLGIDYRFAELDTIVLYVNSVCNMKCLMCDIGQKNKKGIDQLRESQNNLFIGLDLIKKLLNDPYLKKRKIYFHILMTEPLLHPQIKEIIKLIKREGHLVSLTTNGFLLKKKADELIDSNLDMIKISLDGPEKIHDSLRGVEGVFRNAVEGIRILNKNKKLKIRINYTITPLNYLELKNFLDSINNEGIAVDIMKFQFMDFISNEMKEKQNSSCDIKQTESCLSEILSPAKIDVEKLVEQINLIHNSKYENIKEIWIIPSATEKEEISKYFNVNGKKIKNNSKCFFPWTQFAFTTDGKIVIHMRCFNYFYGDFSKHTIKEIFYNNRIKSFRKKLKESDYCFPACTRCCGVNKKKILSSR